MGSFFHMTRWYLIEFYNRLISDVQQCTENAKTWFSALWVLLGKKSSRYLFRIWTTYHNFQNYIDVYFDIFIYCSLRVWSYPTVVTVIIITTSYNFFMKTVPKLYKKYFCRTFWCLETSFCSMYLPVWYVSGRKEYKIDSVSKISRLLKRLLR